MQPTVIWAQRDDYVWLTVEVPNAEDLNVELSDEILKFSCVSDTKPYKFEMKFYQPIVKEESKFLKHRLVDFCLKKKTKEEWPRLVEDKKKVSWIKVDWSKWQDSDAEDEQPGFDMSNMGGFGGMDMSDMAGMAGMGGMGGMNFGGEEDSDDEVPENSENLQPEEGMEHPLIQEVNKAT